MQEQKNIYVNGLKIEPISSWSFPAFKKLSNSILILLTKGEPITLEWDNDKKEFIPKDGEMELDIWYDIDKVKSVQLFAFHNKQNINLVAMKKLSKNKFMFMDGNGLKYNFDN